MHQISNLKFGFSKNIFCFFCRRFAPNVSEVSDEFQGLASEFESTDLFEYAALCYLGASKCERVIESPKSEVHFLLKAARAYKKADENLEKFAVQSNSHEYIDGALNCYNQALILSEHDVVMKAAIIREIKKIDPNCELTSNFTSPAHRAYELDLDAQYFIHIEDYETALDKLTEIHDDLTERKVEQMYEHLLRKNEITRILLLLLLDLPPARQSPSNVKLLERFNRSPEDNEHEHSLLVENAIRSLIEASKNKWHDFIVERSLVKAIPQLTIEQKTLIEKLREKHQMQL